MGEITVKSLYMDDLQRFKISRSGISIHSVRAKLVEKHREVLPRDFVIKYEWGKGLQELREDVQLEEVLQSLEDSGNSSPLRLYLSAMESSDAALSPQQPESESPTSAPASAPVSAVEATPRRSTPSSGAHASPLGSSAAAPFESKMPATPSEIGSETELVYKIMVVGNAGCGKTSIINRFVNNIFSETYKSTVGADFSRKIIQWDEHTTVRLQLWDIAGQDRFAAVTRAFYKNAVGAVVVCDVTRQSTLEAVAQWKAEIDSKVVFKGGSPVPAVLLVNKVDLLRDAEESFRIGAQFEKIATECGFNHWFITSAKTDHNIKNGMHTLIGEILRVAKDSVAEMRERGSGDGSVTIGNHNPGYADYEEEASCC